MNQWKPIEELTTFHQIGKSLQYATDNVLMTDGIEIYTGYIYKYNNGMIECRRCGKDLDSCFESTHWQELPDLPNNNLKKEELS